MCDEQVIKEPSMPGDTTLPFFAYGIFKPGQLGFLLLRERVASIEAGSIKGDLCERDGLAILDARGADTATGSLLSFVGPGATGAYGNIASIEPEHQYRWAVMDVATAKGPRKANVLVGKSPHKGSAPLDREWDGRQDPLFTTALDVVRDVVASWRDKSRDPAPIRGQSRYAATFSYSRFFVSSMNFISNSIGLT
jgi:hypothetical protein